MKVKVTDAIVSLKGEAIQEDVVKEKDTEGKPTKVVKEDVTVGKLIIKALMASYRDDDQCSGEDKIKRFTISSKVQESKGEVELSTDDISFVKKYVNKAGYNPLAYTRVHEALECKKVGENQENGK